MVVIETNYLPLFGMITNYTTLDITMLRWITYMKSLNPKFRHVAKKDSLIADMLSWIKYNRKDEIIDDIDDVGTKILFGFIIE